jgi:hypothetical protein
LFSLKAHGLLKLNPTKRVELAVGAHGGGATVGMPPLSIQFAGVTSELHFCHESSGEPLAWSICGSFRAAWLEAKAPSLAEPVATGVGLAGPSLRLGVEPRLGSLHFLLSGFAGLQLVTPEYEIEPRGVVARTEPYTLGVELAFFSWLGGSPV